MNESRMRVVNLILMLNPSCIHGFTASAIKITWRKACFLGVAFAATALMSGSELEKLKRLSIEELLEIEVTSVSRSPIAFGDAPSALQVITDQEIRRSGASSLPEALRLASNLHVARKNSHDWGISARGFNTELANKLLVMIDGRAVYTPLWSGVRWDVQDYLLEDLDRIEVISGPGGSVWGANAVNGVINITTKSAEETQGLFVEAGGGNQLRDFEAFRYGGKIAPGIFFRVYAKHFERDSEVLSTGVDAADGSSVAQGGFRLDARPNRSDTFTVQSDYYHGREGVTGAGDGKVAGGNLLSRWSKLLANGSDFRLQFYYDRAFLRLPTAAGPFGSAGKFIDDLETYDLDFQHNLESSGAHRIVWGVGYRLIEDDSRDSPTLGFDPRSVQHDLFSSFLQDQIAFGDKIFVTVGTKLEHTEYTGVEVEPSIRFQRHLDVHTMVWGAISRAVRTPSRIDREIRQPSSGTPILAGSDRFASETVVAYEAGLRGQLAQRVMGSVSVFYNDYRKIRSLAFTPTTIFPLVIGNDVEGQSHGVEFTMEADISDRLRIRGGYTYLKSDLHVRAGGMDINNALNETSDPEHHASIGASVDLPWGVEFDSHLRWVDTLENNNEGQVGTVPSYVDLNVRMGVHLSENVEVSLVGQNLLDDHHPEIGAVGMNRVEIRRSVFAKVALRY
jgi:iron complex outermembrane receptor protein